MARGRKKGGLKINPINDRDELVSMIVNQANSLNKKIKDFGNSEVAEYGEYVHGLLTTDMVQFSASGSVTKSKKFYGSLSTPMLKKTLSALHKINNHEFYGTKKKYNKEVTKGILGVQNYAKDYLLEKGYDSNFVNETINSKDFLVKLYGAYNEGVRGYDSDQRIDKIALSYGEDTGFSAKERDKILNNIEYSRNTKMRLEQDKKDLEEYKAERNKKMR